jgi:hypothetical protein
MAIGWGVYRWRGGPTMRFDRGSIWVSVAVLLFELDVLAGRETAHTRPLPKATAITPGT